MDALAPVPSQASGIDRLVYRSELVAVGAFRCPADHPLFADSGPIRNHCVVFPRTRARIEPSGHEAFESDRAVVPVYNAGQQYRRRAVNGLADECDYFALTPAAFADVAATAASFGVASPDEGFRVSHVHASVAVYARQRLVFRRAASAGASLAIDEAVLAMTAEVLRVPGVPRAGGAARPAHRALASRTRAALAATVGAPLMLSDLARMVGASPFHLCRVFRAVTGLTIHAYRERLRIAASIDRLEAGDDLSAVALDLGYSSHSHFTAAFRAACGVTPSGWRRLSAPARRAVRPGGFSTTETRPPTRL
ncbi:MAG: AraC family transcriptional regulator [Vicinamibacterales bacterium]